MNWAAARDECAAATDSYIDPILTTRVTYHPIGFSWQDNRGWEAKANGTLGYNAVPYYAVKVNYFDIRNRSLDYECLWPATPSTIIKECPTKITGKMVGPYSNAVTDAWLRTMNQPWGSADNQKPRTWIVPRTSTIGAAYDRYRNVLSPDPDVALDLVRNCPDMEYSVSVSASEGCWTGSQPNVPRIPKDGTNCEFVPGNYAKTTWGLKIACRYAHYPRSMGGYEAFIGCGDAIDNPVAATAGQAHWKCPPDNLGAVNRSETYNFANCDGNVPPPVACTWSSSSTGIIDPYGVSQSSGVQVAADGKQWKVSFPVPVCPTTAQNRWTQWMVASGSKPLRSGPANASNQPVFGNYDQNNRTTSVLAQVGVRSGVQDWAHPNLYLRFNQATTTTTSKSLKVGGDTSNPVTVKGTTTTPAPVPFGVYALYHYTQPVRVCTNIGGCVTIQVPYVLKTPAVWFYTVSGRVSG